MKMPVTTRTCSTYWFVIQSGIEKRNASHSAVEGALHPMRSFRANSPVGLKTRITMISRNPMASR